MCKRCVPLFEALQEAKDYIAAEGTHKPRKKKRDILKIVRHALSPKANATVQDYERLKKLEKSVKYMYERYCYEAYWTGWELLKKKAIKDSSEAEYKVKNVFYALAEEMRKIIYAHMK